MQTRYMLNKRSYTLTDDGVLFEAKSALTHRSFKVPYPFIPNDTYVVSVYSKLAFWFFTALFTLGCISVLLMLGGVKMDKYTPYVYFVFSLPFGIRFLISRITFVGLRCGAQVLPFYKDNPTKEALDAFIRQLQERKRNYIEKLLADVPGHSVGSELQKLVSLKENGSITEEEFQQLKKTLVGGTATPSRKIGF